MSTYAFDVPKELASIKSFRKLESILGLKGEFLLEVNRNANVLYRQFYKGKKKRLIDNPLDPLKCVQDRINKRILVKIPPHYFMYGGVKGKNIRYNAIPHLQKKIILKLDISKYFQSTYDKRVFNFFRHDLSYGPRISSLLTRLTTRNHYLPQGAPSSTTLVNLLNSSLASEFEKFCNSRELNVSFWVDDITISGKNPEQYMKFYEERIMKYGYMVNDKKTNLIKNNKQQFTPGVVVNRVLSVPKERIKKYSDAIFESFRSGEIEGDAKIRGQIQHVVDINPKQGSRLIKLRKNLIERSKQK